MENRIQIAAGERKTLDALIRKQGYRDYKWMDPGPRSYGGGCVFDGPQVRVPHFGV